MYKSLLTLTVFFWSISVSISQNFTPCLTDQIHQQAILKNPEIIRYENAANKLANEQTNTIPLFKTGAIYFIPVVFHIIHQSGTENISQAQIMDELRILNEDYRKLGRDASDSLSTNPLAADMQIEFRLAQYDPNGKKSDGINRIASTLTVNADNSVKSLSYWDSNRYLNIWVVNSINNTAAGQLGTVLGYAQFPWDRVSYPTTDGIIVRADQIGTVGIGQTSQAGRTLTHEIGHWLGLYHPFQDGCVGGTSSNCSTQGDKVCDTPPVSSPSFGCPTNQNSCSNDSPNLPDLVKDYMDYADGTCMNLYTYGQKNRVFSISFTGSASNYNRVTAASANNLVSAGIGATGNYLSVSASTKKAPYTYGFESSGSLATDGWILNNFNNPTNGWQIKSTAFQSGSSCIMLPNLTNASNTRDGFQSPEIDLTTIATPFLNFYCAYAQTNPSSNDILNVYISDTFGIDEKLLWTSNGGSLSNGALQYPSAYIPNSSQWKPITISLSSYKYFTHARVRYEFQNRRGNNIYIDNFSISNTPLSGIDEAKKLLYKFSLYPNPLNSMATISYELQQNDKVKILLYDMMGREVMIVEDAQMESGLHTLTINKGNLNSGMYFIRFESGENTFNHKLLIN